MIDNSLNNVKDLLLALLKINSTTGQEGAIAFELGKWLQHHGWSITLQPLKGEPNRTNLLAMWPGALMPDVKLVFNSHLDTVPPFIPPTVTDDGAVIKGRGTCDAKSMIACMCMAANRIALSDPKLAKSIALLFVVAEEAGHYGMTRANDLGLGPDFMIVGEPTELKWARRQKGILNVHLESDGIAVHSGYPHLGKHAIEPMVKVLNDLLDADWPQSEQLGTTNINIGIVNGGQAPNATAQHCEAKLLVRLVTDADSLFDQIDKVVAGRVKCTKGVCNDPVELSLPPGVSEADSTVVAFNTDIAYFKCPKTKNYLFGPGAITDAHSAWEYIRVDDLQTAIDVYHDTALQLLKQI